MKKKITILCLLVFALTGIVSGTMAFFVSDTGATNVITTGNIEIELVEKMQTDNDSQLKDFPEGGISGVMPGASVSKIVSVHNKAAESYIRVKVTKRIESADKEPLSLTLNEGTVQVVDYTPGESWEKVGDYYYYKFPVGEDMPTDILFDKVTFAPEMGNEYQDCTVYITVEAQAVQVANNPVPQGGKISDLDAWNYV